MEDLEVCKYEDFSTVRDKRANDNSILVLHNDKVFFYASKSDGGRLSAMVFESNSVPMLFLSDADGDGRFDGMSYEMGDYDKGGRTEVFDNNLDGQ